MSKEEQPRSAQAVLIDIPVDHYHSLLDGIGDTGDTGNIGTSNSNGNSNSNRHSNRHSRQAVDATATHSLPE